MGVEFYGNEFGIVTLVKGTSYYNTISSFVSGAIIVDTNGNVTARGEEFFAGFPATAVAGILTYREGEIGVDAERYNRLTAFFPRLGLRPYPAGTTSDYKYYNMTGSETRQVRTNATHSTSVNPDHSFYFSSRLQNKAGTRTFSTSNNDYPFGYASPATIYSEIPGFFTISFLVCNDDMTEWGYVTVAGGYNNLNQINAQARVLDAGSTTIFLQEFFDGLTPASEDTDPYSGIDGMGEITGGGSGVVGIPGFPGLTAASAGVIGLFAPTAAQMQALASYMWTDFGGEGETTEAILKEVVEAFKRSIANPLDYVVGLNIIPSQGLHVGGSSSIRFGFTDSGVSMPRLSNQYFTVNCGSLHFDPVCGDTFLDYAPYSKFAIYLPYIGVKDMNANDFVGHTIGVVYHGDTVTGGVTAYITKDGSVMYQYSGCCALNIPLSADGWGSTIAGAVQIATSLLTAPAGGAAGVASSAALGAASVAANPSLLSPQVSHSGAVSGGAGCMGVQYPFVIRETVRFHSTAGFNKISGYPSYYYKQLGQVEGYTIVVDVHLQGLSATQGEITEIENLLKAGVIL